MTKMDTLCCIKLHEEKDAEIKAMQAEVDIKTENWEQAEKDLLGCRKKLAKAQACIGDLYSQLDIMHEAFSEDMFTEPRRELEAVLNKHKQEKE